MTRGLGFDQMRKRLFTNYRIILALYEHPCTYEQLWRETGIQRNILRLRLDQLIKDNIIIKHHHPLRYKLFKSPINTERDFYLLNWAEKRSKEMMYYCFNTQFVIEDRKQLEGGSEYVGSSNLNPSRYRLCYEINSIHVKPSEREYIIMRSDGRIHMPGVYDNYNYNENLSSSTDGFPGLGLGPGPGRGRTMESCRSSRSRKKQELKEEEEEREREQGYFVTVSDGMNAYRIYQLYLHWFIGRMRELRMKAKDILEQIMHCIRVKRPVEERDRLIEKRDSILESLVLLCARYYIPVCVKQKHYSLSYLDMLIFCNMIIVFDYYWLPYVKFWEIMERVGYKIMDEKG
jgi:hypothetical protein